jgi:photosystem II stability/assembly factor-like uncharacterized protein
MKKALIAIGVFLAIALFIAIFLTVVRGFEGGVSALYESQDAGDTWRVADYRDEPVLRGKSVFAIEFSPHTQSLVYLATTEGLFVSHDGGLAWERYAEPLSELPRGADLTDITVGPTTHEGELLYLGVFYRSFGRIFKSEDGGITMREVYVTSRPRAGIFFVEQDPVRPERVWAGTGEGILLMSDDFGEQWRKVREFREFPKTLLINPSSPQELTLLFFGDGMAKSFDGGRTWQDLSGSVKDFPGADEGTSLTREGRSPRTLYLGSEFGLLRSRNGGFGWAAVPLIIPENELPVTSIATHSFSTAELYAAAGRNVYVSKDLGETWAVRNIGERISAIAVDPFDPAHVLVGIVQ